MEGVLEAATALCTCKLAFSLLVLPRLPPTRSPISFCCCCLLLFTDVTLTGEFGRQERAFAASLFFGFTITESKLDSCLLAAFLVFLCVSKSWPTELALRGDELALRFLLFLSRVYGAVLLLTCPLVTVETLIRLRGERAWTRAGAPEQQQQQPHGVSFLCCLSVWVLTALEVRWRWTLQDVCVSACLQATDSLLSCLPSLLSPLSNTTPFLIASTFYLLVLLLLLTVDIPACGRASAELTQTLRKGHVGGLVPACVELPQTLLPADASFVDPEKTVSSCVQVSASQHGDAAVVSLERFPAGQKEERTKRAKTLTFTAEAQEGSNWCVWCHRGFPCLGLNVIIGLMGVLCIFVLPLILSLNIVFVQTVDYLMELSVKALLSPAADKRSASTSRKATGSRSTCQPRLEDSGFAQLRRNLEIC